MIPLQARWGPEILKIKVKWSRYGPSVAQRVGRGIAVFFHHRGTRRGWVVSSTPQPHFTPGRDPVPILQEGGWFPGPVWTGGKSRPHRDWIPDRPARSSVTILTELPGPQFLHMLVLINLYESPIFATRAAWCWRWRHNYSSKRRLFVYEYTRRHIPDDLILQAAISGFVVESDLNRYFPCSLIECALGK